MSIENLKSFDPFADEGDPFSESEDVSDPEAPAGRSRDKSNGSPAALDIASTSGTRPGAPTGRSRDKSHHESPTGRSRDKSHGSPAALDIASTSGPRPDAPAGRSRDKSHRESPAAALGDEDIASTLGPKAPDADEVDSSLVSFPYEDPLAETADVGSTLAHLHIRIQQRNGRKTLTTLQGLPKKYSEKKLLKAFKKEFACNGTVIADEKAGKIIQLQGDQRSKIMTFLVEQGVKKDTIMVHGF